MKLEKIRCSKTPSSAAQTKQKENLSRAAAIRTQSSHQTQELKAMNSTSILSNHYLWLGARKYQNIKAILPSARWPHPQSRLIELETSSRTPA